MQALLLCALALTYASTRAEDLKVIVLLSDNSGPYLAFADAFQKNLPGGTHVTILDQPSGLPQGVPPTDLIVAAGTKAVELAASQTKARVLAVMVTKTGYEDLLNAAPRKSNPDFSAIYLNQPWGRQLDFLRAVLPDRRRIGLLHSPDTRIDIEGLRRLVSKQGGALITASVSSPEKLYASLESVFAGSDLLLAVPDAAIYNGNSIRNILLTSYRRGVPLIGLSQSYVNAGALCAIFSTPEQLAAQAAEAAGAYLRNGRLPAPQYPAEFTIAVNHQVAHSLGIEVPSQETILERMGVAQADKSGRHEK